MAIPPTVLHTRTRLKGLSKTDVAVLEAVGEHLGSLASHDLAERCALGDEHGSTEWAERKRRLTAESSSRWAGAITKSNNAAYETARRNEVRALADTRRALAAIEKRALQPTREMPGCKKSGGYGTQAERQEKLRRLEKLRSRLVKLERERKQEGRRGCCICRGGRRLLKNRLHLEEAGLTEAGWRSRWRSRRAFLYAEGESGKKYGNETIRVFPDGTVVLRLPNPLRYLANMPNCRYRLEASATFSHHGEEWLARVAQDKAVAYRIWYSPEKKDRWYVDASFTPEQPLTAPTYEEAVRDGAIGVDLNSGHLACWRLDSAGNPVGSPKEISLELEGLSSTTRDGRLRAAISELLRYAMARGVKAIAIEDLGFEEARVAGRETMGRGKRGKRFRRTVAGIPTARFRWRLVAMASRVGIAVIVVDPAYTTRWGKKYWKEPLSGNGREVNAHHSAAVVIARRGLGHGARRKKRKEKTALERSIEAARGTPLAGAGNHRAGLVRGGGYEGARTKLARGDPAVPTYGGGKTGVGGAPRAGRVPGNSRPLGVARS